MTTPAHLMFLPPFASVSLRTCPDIPAVLCGLSPTPLLPMSCSPSSGSPSSSCVELQRRQEHGAGPGPAGECLHEDMPGHPGGALWAEPDAAATCIVLPVVRQSILIVHGTSAQVGAWCRSCAVDSWSHAIHEPAGTDPRWWGAHAAAVLPLESATVPLPQLSTSVQGKVHVAVYEGADTGGEMECSNAVELARDGE
ncbi:hypothetical protein JB92DRAFT_3106396 [Gautieria morchelliformis]|nr:hypothetical protein JB92DRAFT_3106396 [Gautieria morchelliformis]